MKKITWKHQKKLRYLTLLLAVVLGGIFGLYTYYAQGNEAAINNNQSGNRETANTISTKNCEQSATPCDSKLVNNNCLFTQVAYDVGSSNTKATAALVDRCKRKIVGMITKIPLRDQINYSQDLKKSSNGGFSNTIQESGINALTKMRDTLKEGIHYPYEIRHCAVATSAFRKANNGQEFAKSIQEKTKINFSIISSEEEGMLGFYGVIAKTDNDPAKTLVWDIGGKSMQLTFFDANNKLHVTPTEKIGADTFKDTLMEKIMKGEKFPTPLPKEKVQAAIAMAEVEVKNNIPLPTENIKQKYAVYAIGAIHNKTVQFRVNQLYKKDMGGYKIDDVKTLIYDLATKTNHEVTKTMCDIKNLCVQNEEFAKSEFPNLILVYAIMKVLGIEEVKTLDISNLDGILLKGC